MLNLTPLLKLYSERRLSYLKQLHPSSKQEQILLSLVRKAQATKFGLDHNFRSINSVKTYQERVPLRKYEDFFKEYWSTFPNITNQSWPDKIKFFAASSGTSAGSSKYIPISREIINSNSKAGLDLLCFHLANKANSKIFAGKSFVLGGSTDLVEVAEDIYSGDLSGITVKVLPFWAKSRYFPDQKLALIKNWEEKIVLLAKEASKQDIRSISGVPTWLILFFKELQTQNSNRSLAEIFPKLEMLVHGGVSFAPYYNQFKELLKDSSAEMREVYPASEGFIAIADRGYQEGLRLNLDHSIFFEFIPLEQLNSSDPERHWIHNIELNQEYAIALSTPAGLWSYLIGDTVRFIDRAPARILITGRTSYYMSAFGEHLTGEELEKGVLYALQECQLTLNDFCVAAKFPTNEQALGGHCFVIEANPYQGAIKSAEKVSKYIDHKLSELNEDYAAHRAEGFGLEAPEVIFLKPGSFNSWMKERGKLGGQNKVPRVINNQELFASLIKFSTQS